MITTTKGEMDEALLEKKTGEVDNENEHTTWTEYWLMRPEEEVLWEGLGEQASRFSVLTSHNSDAFALLAAILAYYDSRGTSPEQMISGELKELISIYQERAKAGELVHRSAHIELKQGSVMGSVAGEFV